MKISPIYMNASKHFWERVQERNIDLSALSDVIAKINNARIGETVKGGNQRSTVIAHRDSAEHATLITAYPSKKVKQSVVKQAKTGLRIVSKNA